MSAEFTQPHDQMWTTSSSNTHFVNQSPYLTKHLSDQTLETQAKQISVGRIDPSVVEILNQQQALQKDTTFVISKLSDLQIEHKDDHFLVELQTYYGKGEISSIDFITQVEKIASLTKCSEIQFATAKVKV